MKILKEIGIAAIATALIALGVHVVRASLSGVVLSSSGVTYDHVFPINLVAAGVTDVSVTTTYSSGTYANASFSTGQTSTGTISILSTALSSTASATDSIVVVSTSGQNYDSISLSNPVLPGAVNIRAGFDWNYGINTTSAAISIADALNNYSSQLGGVQFVAAGNVVYATAPVGALYNGIVAEASDTTTITVSSPTFLGGQDALLVSVNGKTFKAGKDFQVGASTNAEASNLAAAINAAAGSWVSVSTKTAQGSNVLSFTSVGAGKSFLLASSNSSAAAASGNMYGAIAPSWSLNGNEITIPSHGLVTGLKVLYPVTANPAISGLTGGTTYYVGVVDANTIGLSTTSALAQSGDYVTLASSSTLSTADSYSLDPLAWSAGSAGFDWEVSNDGSNWSPLAVSSVTYSSSGVQVLGLGALYFKYLGLNVTAPTSGALTFSVVAQGQ